MTKKLLVSPFAAMRFFAVFAIVGYGDFFKQKGVLDDVVRHRFGNYKVTADTIMDLSLIDTVRRRRGHQRGEG